MCKTFCTWTTEQLKILINANLYIRESFQIYLRDFLQRLKSYNIIDLDLSEVSEDDRRKETRNPKQDIDLIKQRELKLQRFQREKELEKLVLDSESELNSNADDDGLMVSMVLSQRFL